MELTVADVPVATCVTAPELDIRLGPRPYLHPVRTLGGVVVSDALCVDHPWHLGVSLSMADVDGWNLWGGRTYVRDEGYVWRDDHGRVTLDEDGLLRWRDGNGSLLLTERRSISAAAASRGWVLSYSYELRADRAVVLGSPATNGRTGGAGYGGFFWRAGPGAAVSSEPNGSTATMVALTVGGAYTLVLTGLAGNDRWFIRTEEYAGVCAALAFDEPLTIEPGVPLVRDLRVLVADGALTVEDAADDLGLS